LEAVNTYNKGVKQWLHWFGPLEIKFAWSGPWTETSLTPLLYIVRDRRWLFSAKSLKIWPYLIFLAKACSAYRRARLCSIPPKETC